MAANFLTALKHIQLETKNSDLNKSCQQLADALRKNAVDIEGAIQRLSEFLLDFEDALLFRNYLSNILLALVTHKIPLKPVFSNKEYDLCSDLEKTKHLEYSVVLGLLSDHPDIIQYALKYFQINAVPPFEVFIHHEDSYNVAPKKRRLLDCRQKISDYHMVSCCHSLLTKLPKELSTKWDWTNFVINFSQHENPQIRWMVKECIVILTNMTEAQSKVLSTNLSITDFTPNIPHYVPKFNNGDNDDLSQHITNVVNIDGILLPIYDGSNVQSGNLVPVKSTQNNLRSLALAVASGNSLCLMGPVGSGKTSLVEHLAAITGRKGVAFKKVQLGDQTDSRMLLGSHQCTDIPGEFVWAPGVLTEAVRDGHWLLLEDIDCAALDVASTLSSLLERKTLCVPGYRDALSVTPGFQLFVTQRTVVTNYGFQKKLSNSSALLQKHLTQINVEPLSRSEMAEIIQIKFPSLTTISPRMIEVFMMFSMGSHDSSLQNLESTEKDNTLLVKRGSRLISTRDLMKWCSRSVVGFNVTSAESALKVLQDAFDIFTSSISSIDDRLELAKKVGTCLGIVETKTEFYFKNYKPNVSLHPNSLEVGRASIPRLHKTLERLNFETKDVVFSFTRQSAGLLEKIACCVAASEPVLLVGETGTGKTSSVQYLAKQTGHKLVVINMNQQSDSADLLGGYKPVHLKYIIQPIKNEFLDMFKSFYNVEKNQKFLGHIDTCFETENWSALLTLMKQSHKSAVNRMKNVKQQERLKIWLAFGYKLAKLEQQVKAELKLTFAFIEGSLIKAMQEGYWVLLDEINLASAEVLECLAGLLEDKDETIELLEKGDKKPVKRHPDFTLFACMNPATDVGKKDLPVGLRNRFTEFFVDELTERNDLLLLIGDYLRHMNLSGAILEAIYMFYSSIKKEARLNLVDGAGNAPHYSLRTLCRALTAAAKAKCGTVSRSLYEAFCLSFLTQLDRMSHPKVEAMIAKAVIGKKNINAVLKQIIPEPKSLDQNYLLFEGHWIAKGKLDINIPDDYILTPTVRKNLRDIARIVSLSRLPVLLQGDTSVGKTSLITYMAKASGNYCVRINNHEHTDLQEYIGSYATDANGSLVFKEGVLVEAMRKGYWIILDELNLAPSDVLEALNRVLDDNRELYIPETQETVRADPNFMLFATQNPPGLYGGRKMLSRAFRNRFVELHFDEIPRKELETILHQRCHIPMSYSKKMIEVMAELQVRRRGSAAVQGKDGFITLRDLFRWGQRYKHASKDKLTDEKFYDWDQHIADEGYLVLAGKVRQADEREIIVEVIEKHIKRKVSPNNLFSLHQNTSPVTKSILELLLNNQLAEFSHVVWTYNMRRLAVLIAKAFTFDEPVLLVGETGCGKTTICQVLAKLSQRQLLSLNCHMHTDSSDFLGGLRPVRQYKNDGRLFEWVDGPLIKAMENGHLFLADEISLADDSVLERMNSLLEPERQLVLSERSLEDNNDILVITAHKNFHFIGTMNPGGDFGKKELSPALRNRFTEIWCDHVTSRSDLVAVLEKSVVKGISLGNQEDGSSGIGNSILDFTDWLKSSEVTNKFPFSIRDLLSWVEFINTTVNKELLDVPEAYIHGACMTFLDCFGTTLTGHIDTQTLIAVRKNAINFLLAQIKNVGNDTEGLKEVLFNKQLSLQTASFNSKFGIKPFYIDLGSYNNNDEKNFSFTAPTTGSNTLRLLRGLQLNKAILLEGNPGVGKTSLVTALAKSSGHKVIRINLSDQTDITDLFGTDLPTEDGSFAFKEGAFLNALQNGDWILLDELNLAPQSVLEGLNACLDHRGEIFIPELGKTFKVKQQTKLFACQNPLKQGGARRGLPVSFLNRFTQVYIDTLTKEDLLYIVEAHYNQIPKDILHKIVEFNCRVSKEITELQYWGHKGGPWEMNLRDIQRWCEAMIKDKEDGKVTSPGKFVDMLYVNRMRSEEDKEKMIWTYNQVFGPKYARSDENPQFTINDEEIRFGDVTLHRNNERMFSNKYAIESDLLLLRSQMASLKAVAQNIKMNWLSILVGPTATGKSSIVQTIADLTGNDLHIVPVTSAMDVSDLLGGFEQVDFNRNLENLYDKIEILTIETTRAIWLTEKPNKWKLNKLFSNLYEYKKALNEKDTNEMEKYKTKLTYLVNHCNKLLELNKTYKYRTEDVQIIMSKVKHLDGKISKLSSVNAGGKFEWIDSLLVKTMEEGSWLLLDNVNLTSAAVLDRLNGLLEPNGVLSIPERGETSEIKPHPNFRVFFTMDPKYGEISRAMRNRGVEIYLLRPEDMDLGLSETMEYFDLIALLSSCGLPSQYHDICIRCHESMTAFIQGFERPTISQLLQASRLTYQQLVRGISSKTALLNSFSDVYIKPRSGSDFTSNVNKSLAEMKNAMLKELQNELEEVYNDIEDITGHTLTVQGLTTNSAREIAKQTAYPIVKLNLVEPNVQNTLHNLFNVLIGFQKCPSEYLNIFFNSLEQDISNKNLQELIAYTYNNLRNEPDLISYKRYYPETFILDTETTTQSNISSALLYNKLLKKVSQNSIVTSGFSAADYANAVTSGKITDDFSEYPILKYCQTYLQVIDNYIIKTIRASQNYFNDNVLGHIMQLLNWRIRFIKMCSQPIFITSKNKRTPILKEDIIPLLQVHSKWIQKYLLEELFKLPPNKTLKQSFQQEIDKMNIYDDQSKTKLVKVTKKLRKLYGQPKLYKNDTEYDICNSRKELNKNITIDMNQPVDKQLYKVLTNPVGFCTSELAIDVPEEKIVSTLKNSILELVEKGKDDSILHKDVKLLPINFYVIKRVLQLLKPYLLHEVSGIHEEETNNDQDVSEILANVVNFGKEAKGFPPVLLSQLEIIQKVANKSDPLLMQRTSSLIASFWDEFYRLLESSPDLYPLSFFNVNDLVHSNDALEAIPTNNRRVPSNLPLMSFYIDKLTTFCDEEKHSRTQLAYKKVALRDRVDYSLQLQALQNVLWKNIGSLDVAAAMKLKTDATFELNKYEQLLRYLFQSISTQPEIIDETDDLIKTVFKELENYFKDFVLIELIVKANVVYENLKSELLYFQESATKIKVKILTAQLGLLTSIILVRIMSEINPIDHVEKYRLKIDYIGEDIDMFNILLSTYYIHGVVSGTVSEQRNVENSTQVSKDYYKEGTENRDRLKKVHPLCSVVMELISKTAEKVHKYASGNTYRPKEVAYSTFVKDCRHFTNSVLANKTLTSMITNLIKTSNKLSNDNIQKTIDKSSINEAKTIIKESTSWLHSVRAFYKKIDTAYSEAFPDLAKPLQCTLAQIIYSVANLTDAIRELIAKIEQGPLLHEMLVNLVVYPNVIPKSESEKYLNRFVTSNFMQLLNRNVIAGNEDFFKAELECLEVLKMNLSELSMICTAQARVDTTAMRAVLTTLGALVKAWEKQRESIERQKKDEEALYVTKSKCEDEDDDEIAYEEIMEMFPSYSEDDFSDFKPPSLEQKVVKKPTEKLKYLLSPDDVTLIYKWHSNLVKNLTNAEWLASPKKLVGNDVKSPILLRYPTFSRIIQEAWDAMDADFEGVASPSLLVLIAHIKANIDGESSQTKCDFYRSAWVSETRECLPLLQKVKDNTNELLDQWPDFPTLKDIIVIVDRILSFPITSPISRFLTGLELLRDKIEEWNKNAHKENNMIDISLEVGQQIVNWRKLEMTHWKECLNSLYQRKQAEAHKYWFYLYGVISSYLDDKPTGEAISSSRVITVLKDFMEMSNLAEYEVRLDIVYVYHCHLLHMESSVKRDELISILWNTYNYYAQFLPQVTTYIKEKRAPIEKKLRDFVKICTWDRDLSYWSVKSTVDKVHKALHKHTKEFEKVLKESVRAQLVAPGGGAGLWDRPRRGAAAGGAYLIDPLLHLPQARTLKKYLDVSDQPLPMLSDSSLLSKIPSLLNKAKALCKDTITNTAYPSLVQALDDFVTLVIETSAHLGSLEVDSTAPKEKQLSQAKSFVQQKRKALADLFKYLARVGLNYRTGLVMLSADEELYDFTIPPVDLEAAMSFLKSRRCDASMSQLWSGCEQYFNINIARHRHLSEALISPHKDLGVQNIERVKGFAAQLMKLTNTQKKSISKYSRYMYDLRYVVTNITNALDLDGDEINICAVKQKLHLLADCYANTSVLLDQFVAVLKALPEKTLNSCEPQFDTVFSNSPIANCFKNSEEWQELYSQVKAIINIVDKQKTIVNKVINSVPKQIGRNVETPIASQNYIDVTNDATAKLKDVIDKSESILIAFDFKLRTNICGDYKPQHPVLRSINGLVDYLHGTVKEIEKLDAPMDTKMDEDQQTTIVNQTEDLVASMLLIIQSLYKNHLPIEKSNENIDVLNAIDEIIDEGNKESESKDILEEKHLKELLQEKLTNDSRMLQLDSLITKMRTLLVNYVEYVASSNCIEDVKTAVMRLVPIMEQMVLFVQYFISQKVAVHRVSCKMLSVLLKIFSDLAANGFCRPSDLDMEEGEGEGGPGKLAGGMGLGDGEGQKDVSERIENQDQLDDAQKPGEEKNQEDKDCKEEEKGVNMTDDFDSHLQDVEGKDDKDSDEENDEDDADKQMGETENAAEKLDQQIWGSEDEEDPEEHNKKDKEERGTGESTGEKEMGAKEQEKGTDDGSDGKDKKKQKDINEMEEPEIDDDQIDPYHGNQQQYPEPEDFDLPEDMNADGEEGEDDKDGETETENPFDIDVMKDKIPEEQDDKNEEDKEKDNKNGLEVSSDEEDGDDNTEQQDNENQEAEDGPEKESKDEAENEDEEGDNEDNQGDLNKDETPDEQPEPESKEDNLPKNNDDINEEDKVEEKGEDPNPQANPSNDDPTAEDKAENAEMERGTNDNVQTNAEQAKDDDAAPFEQTQEQVGEDQQSTGRAELDKSDKGHRGDKQATRAEAQNSQRRFENKPGKTDQERTLGDINEKKHKKAHTMEQQDDGVDDTGADGEKDADAYQHTKEGKKDDIQVVDAATKEQADQQPTLQHEDEEGEEMKEDDDVAMDVDEDIEIEKSEELKPEKIKEGKEQDETKSGKNKEGDDATGETGIEIEGDKVVTETVPRGRDTTYHTRLEENKEYADDLTLEQYIQSRQSMSCVSGTGSAEAAGAWRGAWRGAAGAARALCERLRLVLEPTARSRMAGDFRTGRAINMRRVIPYIASHFRKDRIWLRRTKPAKREYKIAIAIDDSSSMADNRSKELAFESLALVSQALNLLESGDLAVLSFGENPNLLHPFTEQFSEHSGSKILEQLRFEQTKTKIAQLLDFCTVMFDQQSARSDALNAKLLVIVSDGRGIYSEGETKVLQAVRRARQQGIFLVYVIIDNPDNKDSIMDIRRPVMDPVSNTLSGFVPYLDTFPLPFYLILRDITALPNVLGDALRQWFELAANTTS
ncbi:midasin [Aricia agestis]|uniref:midasin n=1 Tax=Aricia agestis TaxID=91739 RepID=UPI001C206191|nr:midasin [Aricia agestis]